MNIKLLVVKTRICHFGCKVTKQLDINRVLAKKKWKNIIGDFYKYQIKSVVWKVEMWLKVEENEKQESVVEIIDG